MELAILITVNIIISFLVYVAFSVRFRMALDKERKNRVPRAFYDNLQMTIQYINTATSAVDEKTQHFYRQLRKSEDVLKRLEKANEDFEKNLKKSRRKTKTGSNPDITIPDSVESEPGKVNRESRTSSAFQPSSGNASTGIPGSTYADSNRTWNAPGDEPKSWSDSSPEEREELGAEGRHMHRLLDRMQGDVIQVSSAEDASDRESPEFSGKSYERPNQNQDNSSGRGSGILARIGGMVGRVLGINSGAFAFAGGESDSVPVPRKSSAFDREVDRMSRAPGFQDSKADQNRNATAAEGWAESGSEGSTDTDYRERRKDYYVSAMDPEGEFRNSFRDYPAERSESGKDSESTAKSVRAGSNKKATRGNTDSAEPSRQATPTPPENETVQPPKAEDEFSLSDQDRRIARVQEFLESTGINLLDTSPQTRAVLIRELGTLGFDPPDIIRATRFPPSEVALVLQLPTEPGDSRRRTRKIRS